MQSRSLGIVLVIGGLLLLVFESMFLFVVFPRIQDMYASFNAPLSVSADLFSMISILVMIVSGLVTLLGIKLIKTTSPSKKLHNLGLIGVITLFILAAVIIRFNVFSVLYGIYNLTDTF